MKSFLRKLFKKKTVSSYIHWQQTPQKPRIISKRSTPVDLSEKITKEVFSFIDNEFNKKINPIKEESLFLYFFGINMAIDISLLKKETKSFLYSEIEKNLHYFFKEYREKITQRESLYLDLSNKHKDDILNGNWDNFGKVLFEAFKKINPNNKRVPIENIFSNAWANSFLKVKTIINSATNAN